MFGLDKKETLTWGNGYVEKLMVQVSMCGWMVILIKESLRIVWSTDKELNILRMVIDIVGPTSMANQRGKENTNGKMVVVSRELFKMVYVMVKDNGKSFIIRRLEMNTMGSTSMIRNVDKGYLNGKMDANIKEVFLMIYVMDMEKCPRVTDLFIKVCGMEVFRRVRGK